MKTICLALSNANRQAAWCYSRELSAKVLRLKSMGLASVPSAQQQINICNLSDRGEWLPQIARWHHDEWLRSHQDEDSSSASLALKLSEREAALKRHLSEDLLPTTFVAHLDDMPIGTVSLVYYQFTNSYEPTEWLTNLFVLPEYRRGGIASQLLVRAIDHAKQCHLQRLLLYTSDQVAFYQKRNWRSINRGRVQGQKVEIMDYELSANC